MRYEEADTSKCLPVELDDAKHIQSALHTGQHLGEAIHYKSVRCLRLRRHVPRSPARYGHPDGVLMSSVLHQSICFTTVLVEGRLRVIFLLPSFL